MKNENEFKDFGTILELLDEKWDSLTQVQKRYISELSAGVVKCLALLLSNLKVIKSGNIGEGLTANTEINF